MTEQPAPPPSDVDLAEPASTVPALPRRQPGEPHPYMLERNPPNLWILIALTIFSLALTVVILALTVVL